MFGLINYIHPVTGLKLSKLILCSVYEYPRQFITRQVFYQHLDEDYPASSKQENKFNYYGS